MQTELKEPERIAQLPHYKGLPVPALTMIIDGVPNFRSIDGDKVWELKRDHKCGICGQKLDYWIAFMVSPDEAESRFVFESPNHEECLRHAFSICPWLYYNKATYSDLENIKAIEGFKFVSAHPDRSKGRPNRLGIYICRNYENVMHKGFRVCKVSPAKRIDWIEGH